MMGFKTGMLFRKSSRDGKNRPIDAKGKESTLKISVYINQVAPPLDWEQYVCEIAADIMKEQSPKRLYAVRQKFYELLVNCIPPQSILKVEHKMRLGSKAIFHLEAFVAKFMSIYKEFLVSTFG
ncbi:hypothetical protein GUJ93_ZPchr0013g36852 [Zizania palustris]|uniref:Uncharacterized protein n=1 Tax=Zizania palustris TaxID=103762 RepID=A0A8J6C3C8_ZIZPA|nr:hypothetical protein GUJ93_ZPchr0013g36852 [Zizania palustris]